ncbi:MAG: YciI family protein [Candidatus Limnocylindria bacterium]
MPQYLLSVHTVEGGPGSSMTEEEMREGFKVIAELEAEMASSNALVFSGRLTEPSSAKVVRSENGTVLETDGPFVESKESIGGFYIIEAADLDAATSWAAKTSAAIRMPIEMRPFLDSRQA